MPTRQLWLVISLTVLAAFAAVAQPTPAADPAAANVFYGAVPPGGETAPVLVFIHGLSGTADFFWTHSNDMYDRAYLAGYRTAFLSMSADNTPNTSGLADNALMIATVVPLVARHYDATQMYFIGHSKGGLDLQYAMLKYPLLRPMVKAVFTLATPNQGAQLADWCFGPGKLIARVLGLLTPAVADLRTVYIQGVREALDPILKTAGIPFFTIAGDDYEGNLGTGITGVVLKGLSGEDNDGLVAPSETYLDPIFAVDMGVLHHNHYQMGSGKVSFPYVNARIAAMEMQ